MAATVLTLVRLRFRVLGNSLARSPLQRVAVILGGVQALALVLVAIGAAWVLLQLSLPFQRQAPWVIGGSVVILGWIVAPLVIGGAEPTLDPRKLSRFPLRPGPILLAELVVGAAWVPGAATLLVAIAGAVVWADAPAAVVAAVLASLLVLGTCVAASRVATTSAADLVARRGASGRIVATVVALLVALAPAGIALAVSWPSAARFEAFVDALSLTPLGAGWAIPGLVAEGRADVALAAVGVAVATIAVLLLLWRLALARALRTRGPAGRRARVHGLGPFRLVPTGPAGAIAARSLVLWFRDSRLVIQLAILPAIPVLLVVLALVQGADWLAFFAAPLAAALLPLSQFTAISYDGTAFSTEVAAAVRGRADRIGRAAAMLTIALPVVVLIAVLAPLAVGSSARIPAMVGLSLAALLSATGVSSVASALVAVPVPAAGRNPFSTPPGSGTTQVLGSYLVTGVTAVVLAPVIVLGIFALTTVDPMLGWLTLAVGSAWGAAAFVGGIALGGRILDRTAPDLLARLRSIRMR